MVRHFVGIAALEGIFKVLSPGEGIGVDSD